MLRAAHRIYFRTCQAAGQQAGLHMLLRLPSTSRCMPSQCGDRQLQLSAAHMQAEHQQICTWMASPCLRQLVVLAVVQPRDKAVAEQQVHQLPAQLRRRRRLGQGAQRRQRRRRDRWDCCWGAGLLVTLLWRSKVSQGAVVVLCLAARLRRLCRWSSGLCAGCVSRRRRGALHKQRDCSLSKEQACLSRLQNSAARSTAADAAAPAAPSAAPRTSGSPVRASLRPAAAGRRHQGVHGSSRPARPPEAAWSFRSCSSDRPAPWPLRPCMRGALAELAWLRWAVDAARTPTSAGTRPGHVLICCKGAKLRACSSRLCSSCAASSASASPGSALLSLPPLDSASCKRCSTCSMRCRSPSEAVVPRSCSSVCCLRAQAVSRQVPWF